MNIANKLTLFRIFLLPFFMLFALTRFKYSAIIATIIFIVASLTDLFDGYIARRINQTTKFGKLMDPLADKLLITTALVSLVEMGSVPAWAAIIIIGREFAVTGLRSLASIENVIISANHIGKIKMIIQLIAVTALLLKLPFATIILYITVIITVFSGFVYFYKYGYVIKDMGGSNNEM